MNYKTLCCIHFDAMNNRRAKNSLEKYIPLNLFARFERVVWGSTVRGSWRPNRTATF